ncbi:hypothetical protein LMG28688_05693 [Paraburkholderia caffeinitolerans]|uniref:Chemotaxis phosphatase CheX-like domain-containing protein n=1 Tax=Paraburkholderia caffeinitolerans TaxID=1723730 RepID=A0A6J5GPK7_9BURK|nr:hypothetical protein [Paraburkholderia caffeinitolerans]CAB3803050.1 hypothetical protein LMG28688_05693 [Paraburkholderia caffeinitolerans]
MIGPQAQESFEQIFFMAARTRLVTDPQHACEIVAASNDSARGEHAVLLTISSMQFRLLLILNIKDDEAIRTYYLGAAEGALVDAFMEFGNLCCGAMNQHLLEHFPDLGMSTPYALDSQCLQYLRELKPDYVQSYALTIDGAVQLGATLCVCAGAPFDFAAAPLSAAHESAGELELF